MSSPRSIRTLMRSVRYQFYKRCSAFHTLIEALCAHIANVSMPTRQNYWESILDVEFFEAYHAVEGKRRRHIFCFFAHIFMNSLLYILYSTLLYSTLTRNNDSSQQDERRYSYWIAFSFSNWFLQANTVYGLDSRASWNDTEDRLPPD